MSLQEILTGGGVSLFILLTLVQIAPVKINPWSALARIFGRAINADVLRELGEVKEHQNQTRERMEEHIDTDDKRNADLHRTQILRFNTELLRNLPHSREDFIEALAEIDEYERYCDEHPHYENNRARCAIENIKRVYQERLEKRDFLQ